MFESKKKNSFSKRLPFKAFFGPGGDQVFTLTPESGELLTEEEDGTLIKVGFIPPAYGKIYQRELIIAVNKQIIVNKEGFC